jgi:hypothetical protein
MIAEKMFAPQTIVSVEQFKNYGKKSFVSTLGVTIVTKVDYEEETREFIFKNHTKLVIKKFPFTTSTAPDAPVHYSYNKSYYDKRGRLHNDRGPAVVMWSKDINTKTCLWYYRGKMIDEMRSVQYDDWMKDKKKYEITLSLVILKNSEI